MSEELKKGNSAPSGDANWAPYLLKEALGENEVKISSLYLTMRDGVKIAVSIYLPVALPEGEKRPAILQSTRYWRAMEMVPPNLNIRSYLANGYVWIGVDARGSGASYGCWSGTTSPEEVQDYDEVVNWIIAQPWSDGSIGTVGVSYNGSTAEMTVTNCNPVVKACIPEFAIFDPYLDFTPGTLLIDKALQVFTNSLAAMDVNELRTVPLGKNKNLQVGVLPVDEDTERSMLADAVAEHANNYNVYLNSLALRFRDDPLKSDPSRVIGDFMPYGRIKEYQRAGVPLYSWSGYGDIGYAMAAVHRFINVRTPGSKLVLGPWNHGGSWNVSRFSQCPSAFDGVAEEIRFFDHYLKGIDTGIQSEALVHYYTMGEERWHATDDFPPPSRFLDLYFAAEKRLSSAPPQETSASDRYQVDYSASTGSTSRWDPLTSNIVAYPDRTQADEKLLCYTSAPLEEDLVITGIPAATLYFSANASNTDVIIYLEDITPEGEVCYITEGELNALHRKLSQETPPYIHAVPYHSFLRKDAMPLVPGEVAEMMLHLFPVSYLMRKGHCIRIALAGADVDHFMLPNTPPPVLHYYREAGHPSHISLPIEIHD